MKRLPLLARLWLLGLLAALGAPSLAHAGKPRLRLERLDPTQLAEGKLRAFASVVELEGSVVDGLNAGEFTLMVDGRPAGRASQLQRFSGTNEEVYVAFVVEVASQYKKAVEPVKAALKEFIEDQPRQFKAMLITYGSDIETKSPLQPAASLVDPIDDLVPDDDSGDVRMVDAVRAAMTELKKIPSVGGVLPRRLIVLVSDGLNFKMDRQTFKTLGDDARKNHIPIHSLAFSPGDERGPLLNLGEISKRSNGTFRWAQRQSDLTAQLATLAEEVRKQYVLSFKVPFNTIEGHMFAVRHDDLMSNRVNGNGQMVESSAAERKGGSWWERLGWWRYLIIVLLILVILYVIGLILQARGAVPDAAPKLEKKQVARPIAQKAGTAQRPAAAAAGGAAPSTATRATLVAFGGALTGSRFEVRGVLSAGKAPGQSITVLDDPTVSSRHAEFGQDKSGFFLKDLDSTNGTFLNNQRVTSGGTVRLSDGDIVRLGAQTQFKVRLD